MINLFTKKTVKILKDFSFVIDMHLLMLCLKVQNRFVVWHTYTQELYQIKVYYRSIKLKNSGRVVQF